MAFTQQNLFLRKWRGKVGRDGIDIINDDGILCTGEADLDRVGQSTISKIILACRDGNVAHLTVEKTGYSSRLNIGKNLELADFR